MHIRFRFVGVIVGKRGIIIVKMNLPWGLQIVDGSISIDKGKYPYV